MMIDRIAFQIGNITIYWYGICVAISVLVGFFIIQYRAIKFKIDSDHVSDLCFYAILGGILGARFLYVVLNFQDYSDNLFEIVRIDHGGLVFYGGFIGACAAVTWYIKRKKLDFWTIADLFALALPPGQAIGRLGCLINGCCFGASTKNWFSIKYPTDSIIFSTQVHKHEISPYATECLPVIPTQITQSLINILIWFILIFSAKKVKHKGQLFSLYLILYAIGRFTNEFYRGDYLTYYAGMTISQIVCLVLLPTGIFFYMKNRIQRVPKNKSAGYVS